MPPAYGHGTEVDGIVLEDDTGFAGLIPELREEGIWLIESLRPKSEPFDELALALVGQLEPNLDGVKKVTKVGKLAESLKKGEVKLHLLASQISENKPNQRMLVSCRPV